MGTALVAASSAALPWVNGYGTPLFQIVSLWAWALVSAATSERNADLHHGPIWIVAGLINLALFLAAAVPVFLATRARWPRVGAFALLAWTALYLLLLFVWPAATDGP